jgi:hypothetical protein
MLRRLIAASAMAALLGTLAPAVATAQDSWDGLAKVDAKRLDAVFLLPGADFRAYNKVMLDPTEVAFKKDWMRDQNNSTRSLGSRISDADVRKGIELARKEFEEILGQAYTDAGYTVVTEAAPDVLRVRTAVVNLDVVAPDMRTAARSRTYADRAGEATIIVEVRDSLSGELLGRAADRREAGLNGPFLRDSMSNRADFRRLFRTWSKISADGMTELKARSPLPAS